MSNDKHLEQLANAMDQISRCIVQVGDEPHAYLRMATKEQSLSLDEYDSSRKSTLLPKGDEYIGENIRSGFVTLARAVVYLADSLTNNPHKDGKPVDSEGETS